MKNLVRALAVVAFLVWTSTAMAGGEFDIGGVLKSGPVDEAGYSVAVSVEEGNLSVFGKYHYAERDAKRYDEKGHAGIEHDYIFTDSAVSWWLFDKVGTDFARKIRVENYGGTGLKYTFLDNELHLSLSAGYLHHYTEWSDDSKTTVHRASIRPKAKYKNGPWDIRWVGYYQPSMDEPEEDYITESTGSVGYWLNKTWGLKLERQDEFRSMAVKDKHRAETSVLLTKKW